MFGCVQVLEDAGREFQAGPEQALVAIAKAELAIARSEVDAALTLLRSYAHNCSAPYRQCMSFSAHVMQAKLLCTYPSAAYDP